MVVVLIVAICSQAILLVIVSVSGHSFFRLDRLDFVHLSLLRVHRVVLCRVVGAHFGELSRGQSVRVVDFLIIMLGNVD